MPRRHNSERRNFMQERTCEYIIAIVRICHNCREKNKVTTVAEILFEYSRHLGRTLPTLKASLIVKAVPSRRHRSIYR